MEKWEELYRTLDEKERCFYRGLYQAYAWDQGYRSRTVRYRVPDEYAWISDGIPEGFNLSRFMAVVADMDSEGFIHYWFHEHKDGDDFLWLGCTEDDSLRHISELDKWRHASSNVWYEEMK